MTRQETFKRRIRARMAKTGERYGAARRALIELASGDGAGDAGGGARTWVSQPELSDEAVREATGRGWDEWCDVLDAWEGRDRGHTAIAAHLIDDLEVPGWWAQTVTVGYERITGRRLPYQRSDGTFNANKSRTVSVDADALRALLLDDHARADLFPGLETELRSRPTSKVVRLGIGPGVAQIDLAPKGDGRVVISVAHERLPEPADVEAWKAYWQEWLEAVDRA